MSDDFLDAVAMRPAQEQTARVVPILAERLTALADRRRVDQRQHLLEVPAQQCVKQRFVGVLQTPQEDVAIEVAGELAHCLKPARRLHLQCPDMGRQQTMQRESRPFVFAEGSTLVEHGIGQQRGPFELGFDRPRRCGWALVGHG